MKEMKPCGRCGAELSEDAVGGLCPRCLMALNFESRTMPEGEAPPQLAPLSPEEMREHFPQFEILECLGRGGMGVVYKARQKALDRVVAIKVLAGEWQGDPGFAGRFEREAKTLAQMSHPNIVTVHDFGEAGGLYYIVMEYVDGVNLRDLLREGKMDPEQALAIVPPVCEALEYAHGKGVVHRDIKPENVLLDREGRVKIADFGIASLVGGSGEKSGTPPYMAPEQEKGSVDKRADIYALGVVLYEMLTGERPAKDVVVPSRKVEVDMRIDEMVLRALEKEPERRYQTAAEFRTVVETVAKPPAGSQLDTKPCVASLNAPSIVVPMGLWLSTYSVLLGWLFISSSKLPNRMASHFDIHGQVDGWMVRGGYLVLMGGLPLFFAVLFGGVSWAVVRFPSLANIPRRDYWLASERREFTSKLLLQRFMWLNVLMTGLFCGLHSLLLQANRLESPRLEQGGLTLLLLVSFSALLVWIVSLLMRFAETGESDKPSCEEVTPVDPPNYSQAELDAMSNDPANWRFYSSVYFCRQDPRIVVPRRLHGFGWTVNFARPWSIPFTVALVVAVSGLLKLLRESGYTSMNHQILAILAILFGVIWTCHRLSRGPQRRDGNPPPLVRTLIVGGIATGLAALLWTQPTSRAFQISTSGSTYGFAPAVSLIVPEPHEGGSCILDFESGSLMTPPDLLARQLAKGIVKLDDASLLWLRETGADAVVHMPSKEVGPGLRMFEGMAFRLAIDGKSPLEFDEITPADVADMVRTLPIESRQQFSEARDYYHAASTLGPAAMAFVTREGTMGVLEIFGPNSNPQGLRIRYKLVTPPSAATSTSVVGLSEEAWQFWRAGQSAEARSKFEQVVKLAPGDADAWNGLGWSCFNSGDSETAENAFQKVLELEPNHPGALNGLGQIYFSLRQYEQAEDYLLKAAERNATAAWFGLARLYLLQGKYQEAEKWAQMLVDAGQADETTKKMLEAASQRKLPKGLRMMIEPAALDRDGNSGSTEVSGPSFTLRWVAKQDEPDTVELPDATKGQVTYADGRVEEEHLKVSQTWLLEPAMIDTVNWSEWRGSDKSLFLTLNNEAHMLAVQKETEERRGEHLAAVWRGKVIGVFRVEAPLSDGLTIPLVMDDKEANALERELKAAVTTSADTVPAAIRTDQIIISDLALQMIVAIREKDDEALKTLASDRIGGWKEALPTFALELRERFRQVTGKEGFELRPGESKVRDGLGAVRCVGGDELGGKCVVMLFVKTKEGWKNCLLRAATEDVPLDVHLGYVAGQLEAAAETSMANDYLDLREEVAVLEASGLGGDHPQRRQVETRLRALEKLYPGLPDDACVRMAKDRLTKLRAELEGERAGWVGEMHPRLKPLKGRIAALEEIQARPAESD